MDPEHECAAVEMVGSWQQLPILDIRIHAARIPGLQLALFELGDWNLPYRPGKAIHTRRQM